MLFTTSIFQFVPQSVFICAVNAVRHHQKHFLSWSFQLNIVLTLFSLPVTRGHPDSYNSTWVLCNHAIVCIISTAIEKLLVWLLFVQKIKFMPFEVKNKVHVLRQENWILQSESLIVFRLVCRCVTVGGQPCDPRHLLPDTLYMVSGSLRLFSLSQPVVSHQLKCFWPWIKHVWLPCLFNPTYETDWKHWRKPQREMLEELEAQLESINPTPTAGPWRGLFVSLYCRAAC